GAAVPERFVVMVGDAELDEGNIWEMLGEDLVRRLGNVLWIVDVNRQSLDRIVPDARPRQLADMFRAGGWRVDEPRWGRRLQERDRPTVILAHTIKGWGLPFAADPLNHTMVTSAAQIETLRASLGVRPGEEWAEFAADTPEGRHLRALPSLFTAPAPAPIPGVPETVDESYAEVLSTQEAFGRVLAALGRLPVGDSIVTVSADVAVTTHLAGWMNRRGIYHPDARIDAFADVPQALKWREGPRGQHVELGIAEHDLFLLLAALGLTAEVSGQPLLPIGTLYDPFVTRGLDALYHALYAGGRFVVVATPSGVSLRPRGAATSP